MPFMNESKDRVVLHERDSGPSHLTTESYVDRNSTRQHFTNRLFHSFSFSIKAGNTDDIHNHRRLQLPASIFIPSFPIPSLQYSINTTPFVLFKLIMANPKPVKTMILGLLCLSLALVLTGAYDPDLLQDFCVADDTSAGKNIYNFFIVSLSAALLTVSFFRTKH